MLNDGYLDYRLRQWGAWHQLWATGQAGWPKKSIMAVFMERGILLHGSPNEPPNDEKAEQIDGWVKRMGQEYPLCAQAVCDYYFNPHLPLRVMASKRGISISTLKERVKDAKVWLSGRLSAYEEETNVYTTNN